MIVETPVCCLRTGYAVFAGAICLALESTVDSQTNSCGRKSSQDDPTAYVLANPTTQRRGKAQMCTGNLVSDQIGDGHIPSFSGVFLRHTLVVEHLPRPWLLTKLDAFRVLPGSCPGYPGRVLHEFLGRSSLCPGRTDAATRCGEVGSKFLQLLVNLDSWCQVVSTYPCIHHGSLFT